jgi:hypothetical protein
MRKFSLRKVPYLGFLETNSVAEKYMQEAYEELHLGILPIKKKWGQDWSEGKVNCDVVITEALN